MKSRIENGNERDKEYEDNISEIIESTGAGTDEEKEHDLLAGYTDENGTLHKTFTLREMNGADEEAVNRSDIKTNGAKVSTTLLARCTTSIGTLTKKSVGNQKKWEDIIKSLFIGDRDIMLLELRRLSMGDEITINHVCPNPDCKAKLTTIINVDELEITEFDGITEIPFELPKGFTDKKGVLHRTGIMRRPNGLDGEILTPVAKNNLAKAETTLLTRICKFDDGAYIDDSIMAQLTIKDRNYLQGLLNEHFFGVNMSVDVMCDRCGEYFKGNLNQTNFI